jgi:hypothetical protein
MAYNRPYSVRDVIEILRESEHRPRPDIASGTGPKGHAISLHSKERYNKFSRPSQGGGAAYLPTADSTFLVDRNSLALMVHEALNSPPGQRALEQLNAPEQKCVAIRSVILRQGADFDVFTVYRPKKEGQTSFDWLSAAKGDGYIVQIFVLVYKIPDSSEEAIHIQTAFPEDYARTLGDSIVRAEPRPGSKHYKGSK